MADAASVCELRSGAPQYRRDAGHVTLKSETPVVLHSEVESAILSEPPELPNSDGPLSENPFAPSLVGTEFDPSMRRPNLDLAYWIGFGGLLIGSVMLSLIGFPIGWVGVFASIAAAIRVPLLQHKHLKNTAEYSESQRALLQPIALLFTSLALNVVFVVVACIAFVAVCLPGTIAFGFGDVSNMVAMVSGLFGLLCFCAMFVLSLRLRF